MYESIVQAIVAKHGGYRETSVLAKPHTIDRTETWNKDHKVLEVTEEEPQSDGYRKGFAVDLVTLSIVG